MPHKAFEDNVKILNAILFFLFQTPKEISIVLISLKFLEEYNDSKYSDEDNGNQCVHLIKPKPILLKPEKLCIKLYKFLCEEI